MNNPKTSFWLQIVTLFVVLALAVLNVVGSVGLVEQGTTTNFTDLAVSNTLSVTGATTLTGSSTASNDFTVAKVLNVNAATYTSVGVQTLNPTSTFYSINPASALTVTLGTTGVVAGDLLILYDAANQAVVIVDSNVKTTSGSALTLGQYDVATFIFDGTSWIEISLAADS
jgi:hypothetical protein